MKRVSKSKQIASQLSKPQQRLLLEMADGAYLITWGRVWTVVRPHRDDNNRRTTNPPVLALHGSGLIRAGDANYIMRITPMGHHVARALSA